MTLQHIRLGSRPNLTADAGRPRASAPIAKLAPSVPWLVMIALTWVRAPKRIKRFATAINAKVDLPGFNEATEQIILESALGTVLDASVAALRGENVISVISKRDTTRAAVILLRDNIHELLGPDLDIPFVSEGLELWTADEIVDVIDNRVLPWIDSSAKLQ